MTDSGRTPLESSGNPATTDPVHNDGHDAEKAGLSGDRVAVPKGYKLGFITFPAYRSPMAQILVVAFVCFLCPGMFNALSGVGGGGQLNPVTADEANVAVYATFAVVGFMSGTFCNFLGIRLTLALGGFGYFLYAAAFLSYNFNQNSGFVIFAGFMTGLSAGLLWTAQGVVCMSYPLEHQKGMGIAIFWAVFNVGSIIGACIPLGENFNNSTNTVTNGTYIAFMVLMFAGFLLAFALLPASKVIRDDGSRVENVHHPGVLDDIKGLYLTLKTDPFIILFFPLFISSNFFYTYQFNEYNSPYFSIRARSLNNLLYWTMQIIGAIIYGKALDWGRFSRKTKAITGWIVILVLTCAVWGGGTAVVVKWPRDVAASPDFQRLDIYDSGYFVHLFLYMWYGFMDASYQIFIYWCMGALTNDSRKLAYFAGFYKGIQSAGAAIAFRLDSLLVAYAALFGASWGLMIFGLLCAFPVLLYRIHATETAKVDEEVEIKHGLEYKHSKLSGGTTTGIGSEERAL